MSIGMLFIPLSIPGSADALFYVDFVIKFNTRKGIRWPPADVLFTDEI